MSHMKTEVVVVRLTKHERALLDAVKTKPLLADWLKEIAMAEVKEQEKKER
ncbi:MbeCy [Providencia vermicola]|uniref:MbeCy n=1 Tax=Providencia vermicola TaxID=333965 RepID=UPI00220B5BC8|nr:MbeCy [Providencia stuartii]